MSKYDEKAREIVAALQVLDRMGYAVVPKEPTGEMIVAAQRRYEMGGKWEEIYRDIVKAAPSPPEVCQ